MCPHCGPLNTPIGETFEGGFTVGKSGSSRSGHFANLLGSQKETVCFLESVPNFRAWPTAVIGNQQALRPNDKPTGKPWLMSSSVCILPHMVI